MSLNRSKRIPIAIVFIAASTAACSTINTVREDHAQLLKTQPITGPGHDAKLHASVTQAEDSFTVVVTRDETCEVRVEKVLHRTTTVNRKVESKATLILEYGIGAAMLVAGALVTVDASNVPMPNDPAQSNTIGRTGAYGIGAGLFALGTAGVVMGIVDSRRARDGMEDGGIFTEPANDPPRQVSCNGSVVPNTAVLLRPNVDTSAIKRDDITLGPTDTGGTLVVSWNSLPSTWFDTSGWVRTAAVVANGTELVSVPLERGRAQVAEAAWIRTRAANSAADYRAFLDNFSEAHHDEAVVAYRSTRVPKLDTAIAAALSAKDVKRAESIVEEWATLDPENVKLVDVRARTKELKIDLLLAEADKRISTATKDRLDDLNEAQTDIEQAIAISKPDDARVVKRTKRLAQLKTQIVAALSAESRTKATKGDFDGADGTLAAAAKLAPDSKAIDGARKTIDRLKQVAEDRRERVERQKKQRCERVCKDDRQYGYREYKACMNRTVRRDFSNFSDADAVCTQQCVAVCVDQ